MTDDSAMLERTVFIPMLQASLERRRELRRLRAKVERLEHELALAKAHLEIEEGEYREDSRFVRDMFEQWKLDLASRRDLVPAPRTEDAA